MWRIPSICWGVTRRFTTAGTPVTNDSSGTSVPDRMTELAAHEAPRSQHHPGQHGGVVAQQRTLSHLVTVHHHAVADAHVVLYHQTVPVDYGALLYVDVVADDDGFGTVPPDGHAGPDAAVFPYFHFAYHVGRTH